MLKDDTKNDNVLDVLLQFTFEPYDTLIKDPNFTLTYNEYSSVVGKTVDLPDLKVVLELNVG